MDWTEWLAGLHVSGEMNAGEILVGVGTLLLAVFTWQLARQTKNEVKTSGESLGLTREGVELSRQSIEALDMPFVIATPPGMIALGFIESNGEWMFECRLWNLGKGPAIVTDVSMRAGDELLAPLETQRPVAAGQSHDATIPMLTTPPGLGEEDAKATLRVYYSHASGAHYMTVSRVHVHRFNVYCESFARMEADERERTAQLPDPDAIC